MSRESAPVIVPSDAVITRTDAPKVAVLDAENTVRHHQVQLGRDFGATLEVLTGLRAGDKVIIHPGDDLAEGTKVQPVPRNETKTGNAGGGKQGESQSGSTEGGQQSDSQHEKTPKAGGEQKDEQGGGPGNGSQTGAPGSAPTSGGQKPQTNGVPEKQTSDSR